MLEKILAQLDVSQESRKIVFGDNFFSKIAI